MTVRRLTAAERSLLAMLAKTSTWQEFVDWASGPLGHAAVLAMAGVHAQLSPPTAQALALVALGMSGDDVHDSDQAQTDPEAIDIPAALRAGEAERMASEQADMAAAAGDGVGQAGVGPAGPDSSRSGEG